MVNFIKSKQGITEDLAQDIIAHVTSESQQGSSTDLMEIYGLLSHSLKVGNAVRFPALASLLVAIAPCAHVPFSPQHTRIDHGDHPHPNAAAATH